MSNVKDSQKTLLAVLLVIVIIFAAYRFGYSYFEDKAATLNEESQTLQEEIDALRAKEKNIPNYKAQKELNQTIVKNVLAQYGPGVTPEKSIMFVVDTAKEMFLDVSSISFGSENLLFTANAIAGVDEQPVEQYVTTMSIAYETTYAGLKNFLNIIRKYPEKMNVDTLSVSYNSEKDTIFGVLAMSWYRVSGTDKKYEFADLEDIEIGEENIFHGGSGVGIGSDDSAIEIVIGPNTIVNNGNTGETITE